MPCHFPPKFRANGAISGISGTAFTMNIVWSSTNTTYRPYFVLFLLQLLLQIRQKFFIQIFKNRLVRWKVVILSFRACLSEVISQFDFPPRGTRGGKEVWYHRGQTTRNDKATFHRGRKCHFDRGRNNAFPAHDEIWSFISPDFACKNSFAVFVNISIYTTGQSF